LQLQVKDVAQFFGVSEKTIYRWIEQDGLPAFRINKQYRFNRVEILEWATARKVNASPQLLRNPVEDTGPLPDFAEALEDGGVFYRVDGTDKDSVLRSVVTLLRLPDAVDREFLLQVLLEREAMGSTSVGDGIAIPHVRNPIVLHIPRPTITLCFLENAIDFGALDGQPVSTLFTIVSPTIRAHLHVLSSLAFALRDPEFQGAIARQATREAIFTEARRIAADLAASKPAATPAD
jgi:PTS system nitrogen regulatory IIA component